MKTARTPRDHSEGRYLSINQAGARMFGLTEEAIIGRRDDEIFDAEIAGIFRLEDRHVVTNGIACMTEEKSISEATLVSSRRASIPCWMMRGR